MQLSFQRKCVAEISHSGRGWIKTVMWFCELDTDGCTLMKGVAERCFNKSTCSVFFSLTSSVKSSSCWWSSRCLKLFLHSIILRFVLVSLASVPAEVPLWWSAARQSLWRATMFPCHVTPWPPAEPPTSCGTHALPAQPSQPLPDLLCSCPAPPSNTYSETPSPDPMESLIVVTEYEPSRPPGEAGGEEEVRGSTAR